MNVLDRKIEEIENELKGLPIRKDVYEQWKNHDVTRRFFLEMEAEFLFITGHRISGKTIEEIALNEASRSKALEVLENVLNWTPEF